MRSMILSSTAAPLCAAGPSLSGVWELFSVTSNFYPRLDELAAIGCDVIMNYSCLSSYVSSNPTIASIDEYANAISDRGMKILWCMQNWDTAIDLRSIFPAISSSLGATSHTDFIVLYVNHVKNLPATYGYYIQDETRASRETTISYLRNAIRIADTVHPIVGTHTSNQFRNSSNDFETMSQYEDIVGMHLYPIGMYDSDAIEIANTQGRIDEVMDWLAPSGKSFMAGCQCNDVCVAYSNLCQYYPRHRWPTVADMSRLRSQFVDIANTVGVTIDLIMWYSYFDIKRNNPDQLHNLNEVM